MMGSPESAYNDKKFAETDANGFPIEQGLPATAAGVGVSLDANGFPIEQGLPAKAADAGVSIDANGFPIEQAAIANIDSNGFLIQNDGKVEPSDATGFPVSYNAADYASVPNETASSATMLGQPKAAPSATMLGQPNPEEGDFRRARMLMGVGVLPDGGLSGWIDNVAPGMDS